MAFASGYYKTTYFEDLRLIETRSRLVCFSVMIATLVFFPLVATPFLLDLAVQVFLALIGSVALMLLTGYAGQISLGHAGLVAAGAFTTGILFKEINAPILITLPASGLMGAILGLIFGLPSLRLKGLYLALSTLSLHFIVIYLGAEYETHRGFATGILVGPPQIGPLVIEDARTFQHNELFQHMSVLENLLVGRHLKIHSGALSNGLFWGRTRREEIESREAVEKVIEFLELEKFRKTEALSLAYGLQKIVGLGRALSMEPQILLLDEPSAGMNRQEKEDLARFILRIKYEIGITMIWVEHDMQMVGDLADRIVVLNFGHKLAEGEPEDVLNDPQVIEAYLGAGTPRS